MKRTSTHQGFTIVELLIVIVVIGILAAITIVAYNGVQQRATFAAYKSDIGAINKAIQMYHADNGAYPGNLAAAGGCWTNSGSGTGNFISGLAPKYIAKIPSTPSADQGNYYAYCFSTGGVDYKVMRLVPSGETLPEIERTDNPQLDTARPSRGWGYWSTGGSGL